MSQTGARRLAFELRELQQNKPDNFAVCLIGSDLLVWHFVIKGPRDSPFEGGVYHGVLRFTQNYPYEPPNIQFLTPNGRWVTNSDVCLSFTSYHPELWSPGWGVDGMLTSVIAFMPTPGEGALGAIDTSDEERRRLARESRDWKCPICDLSIEPDPLPVIPDEPPHEEAEAPNQEPVNQPENENWEDGDNNDPLYWYHVWAAAKDASELVPFLDVPILVLVLLIVYLILYRD